MMTWTPALETPGLPLPAGKGRRPAIPRGAPSVPGVEAPAVTRAQLLLVQAAAFLYVVSMHKFSYHDPWTVGTGVQGVLEAVSIALAFLFVVVATRTMHRRFAGAVAPVCFAAFALLTLCSSWRSGNPALSATKGVLLLMVLSTAYLTSQAGLSRMFLLQIFRTYAVMVFVGLLVGLALPRMYPLITADEITGRNRLSVFSTHPGILGEDLALFLLLMPLLSNRRHRVLKIFSFAMVILSGGKTSAILLCFFYLLQFVVLARKRSGWHMVLLVGGSCLLGAVALFLSGGMGPRQDLFAEAIAPIYGTHISSDASTLDGRLQLWLAALRLLPTAVPLGYGFDGIRDYFLTVASWAGSSHNGYLELLLSGGCVAFAFFLAGVVSVGWYCVHAASSQRVFALCVLGYLLINAVEGNIFTAPSFFGLFALSFLPYLAAAGRAEAVRPFSQPVMPAYRREPR